MPPDQELVLVRKTTNSKSGSKHHGRIDSVVVLAGRTAGSVLGGAGWSPGRAAGDGRPGVSEVFRGQWFSCGIGLSVIGL